MENFKQLRENYRKELLEKFGSYGNKMNKELTREYCQIYGYSYPENLDYEWAQEYDWGNDFWTEMKLTFFTTKDPGYFCSGWSSSDGRAYALLQMPMNNKNLILEKYPYTEEELKEFELEKQKKEQEAKEKQFKINKKPYETKFKFGKYKGKLIVDIEKADPKYIDWCLSKIPEFKEYLNKIKTMDTCR